ncbi:MAG: hypothetical protein KatS3mg060_2122 [Dehalococcoidia bacterium]|nr:MAG: hypothetical protein KatS3mg060_2122 [Dehalococcoidia bacterium]
MAPSAVTLLVSLLPGLCHVSPSNRASVLSGEHRSAWGTKAGGWRGPEPTLPPATLTSLSSVSVRASPHGPVASGDRVQYEPSLRAEAGARRSASGAIARNETTFPKIGRRHDAPASLPRALGP